MQKFVLVTEMECSFFLSQDRPSFLDLAVRSQFYERYILRRDLENSAIALLGSHEGPLAGGFVQHRLDRVGWGALVVVYQFTRKEFAKIPKNTQN